MAFFEVLFPSGISYGSSGGPGFLTRMVSTQAGFEYRSAAWERQRATWNAAHGLKNPSDYKALIAFFYTVGQGKVNGFRWKDWLDYLDDGFGTIQYNSAGYLQLAKTYTSIAPVTGSIQPSYTRFIDKPTPGTLTLPGGVTCDYTSGLVSGTAAPNQTWTGQFHVPVRFDIDHLDMSIDQPWGAAGADVAPSWRNIPIVELKLAAPVPNRGRVSQTVFECLRTSSFTPGPGHVSQVVLETLRTSSHT